MFVFLERHGFRIEQLFRNDENTYDGEGSDLTVSDLRDDLSLHIKQLLRAVVMLAEEKFGNLGNFRFSSH